MSDCKPQHPPRKRASFLGGNYFIYYLVLALFLPYFPLYCHSIGFSKPEVGSISAIRTFASVVFPFVWAFIVDRYQCRNRIFLLCHVLSALAWAGFLLTEKTLFMMGIMILYGIFHSPLIGFMEAFTVDYLGPRKQAYGKIRAWGSVSFIAVVAGAGFFLHKAPIRMILWLILIGSLAGAALAFFTPIREPKKSFQSIREVRPLFSANGILFLFLCFIMLFSHGTYYGFLSIHLKEAGFSARFIGLSWALASLSEIGIMVGSGKLFRRFSLQTLFILSFAVAALRWFLLGTSTDPVLILFTQLLHAVTYAVFHMTSILLMDTLVAPSAKTMGQTILNSVSYGLGMMMGFLINGWGFEKIGGGMFYFSSLIALSGGLLSCKLKLPPESGPEGSK